MRYLLSLLALIFMTAESHAASPQGIPGTWTLVWADHFNGTSLNLNKWTPNWLCGSNTCISPPVRPGNELQCYDPAQVALSDGVLRLRLIAKSCTINGKTFRYRSGMIQSDRKFSTTYGAFEARIYLPAASISVIANWPAWWTGGQPQWPNNGEMDVMEGIRGRACFHFHSPTTNAGGCPSGKFTGWHTYGAEWKPGRVDYYYDGKRVGSTTSGVTSSPMFLILNLATSKLHGGPVVVPSTMSVAYVRVFKRS